MDVGVVIVTKPPPPLQRVSYLPPTQGILYRQQTTASFVRSLVEYPWDDDLETRKKYRIQSASRVFCPVCVSLNHAKHFAMHFPLTTHGAFNIKR